MKRALVCISLVAVLAGAAFAFGDKDQGILKAENLRVLETPAAYPVVDSHVHIDATDAAFEFAVKAMDASGVATVVNLSGGSGRSLDTALALAAKYPGRFVTFCGVRLSREDWAAPDVGEKIARSLEESRAKGAAGFGEVVKWALQRRIDWDDPRLEPMWSKLEELKMPINWHVADPSRYWRTETPTNMLEADSYLGEAPLKQELLFQQERVLEKHPNLIVVASHGNWLDDQLPYLVYRFEKYPNYYIDLSAVSDQFGVVPDEFTEIALRYSDRMLFGTDAGFNRGNVEHYGGLEKAVDDFRAFYVSHFLFFGTSQKTIPVSWKGNPGRHFTGYENGFARYANDGLALPDDVLKKIYYENARRVLGIR